MDYVLTLNNKDKMIDEYKVATLLGYLSDKDVTLYLMATNNKTFRMRVVPIVQWIAKNQEENPDFKLKVVMATVWVNKFQKEFLDANHVEQLEDNSNLMDNNYTINPQGQISLDGKLIAQIFKNRIKNSLPE